MRMEEITRMNVEEQALLTAAAAAGRRRSQAINLPALYKERKK